MAELNTFPWDKVGTIVKDDPEGILENLTLHLPTLRAYEQEIMERLLLVRSEIDDAEQYLKVLQ